MTKTVGSISTIEAVQGTTFKDLKVLNVLMTSKCNLQCKYCYEQHTEDYGKFTVDGVKKLYDFLHDSTSYHTRFLQFFGGEPLLQKELILDFCRTFATELDENKDKTRVSIVTNGTLLTPEFIHEFCSYSFTSLLVSLDTDVAAVDGRNLDQSKIDHIFDMLKLSAQYNKDNSQAAAVRCTMSEKNAPYLKGFVEHLYEVGIRCIVIHPLIMSKETGFIEWDADLWNKMEEDLLAASCSHDDFDIKWAEGLGFKTGSSCLTGNDMIAVDASGDFSGCHFFTNLKAATGGLLLGNIFRNEIYVDRYTEFKKLFMELMQHPDCVACDMKGICYQCPAGNVSTDGILFRPDAMCKKIVSFSINIREDRNKRQLMKKFEGMLKAYDEEGDIVFSRVVLHFIYFTVFGKKLNTDVGKSFEQLPSVEFMLNHYKDIGDYIRTRNGDIDNFRLSFNDAAGIVSSLNAMAALPEYEHLRTTAPEMFGHLCRLRGINYTDRDLGMPTAQTTAYFLSLMHLLVFGS